MERQLLKIANLLYINMQYVTDNSLLKGKMGLILFFYEYGRFAGNTMYSDVADIMLDDIIESLSSNENEALAGIGWGIQYLINNKFVEGDPDEVLSEIDDRMMQIITHYDETQIEKFQKKILRNEYNLFVDSYILSRANDKIRNAENVKHIIDIYQNILQTSKELLPISFLNTCYAFLSCVYSRFINMNDIAVLTETLNDRFNAAFADNCYNRGNLKFLSRIRNMSLVNLKIDYEPTEMHKTMDSYFYSFIPELLYGYNDFDMPEESIVNNYICDVINNVSNENLSLNGLAGVGLMLIKKLD